MKLLPLLFVLFSSVAAFTQEISFQLFIEDSIGDTDTITYRHDPTCSQFADLQFGEEDIYGLPWDTSLEARFFTPIDSDAIMETRNLCAQSWYYGDTCSYSYAQVCVKTDHWPIIVGWDSSAISSFCQEEMFISCSDILWNGDYTIDGSVPYIDANMKAQAQVSFPVAIDADLISDRLPIESHVVYIMLKKTGISIAENDKVNFSIGPNPCSEFIDVTLVESSSKKLRYRILDLSGRSHIENTLTLTESHGRIQTSHIPTGFYILEVFGENETLFTSKLSIKH